MLFKMMVSQKVSVNILSPGENTGSIVSGICVKTSVSYLNISSPVSNYCVSLSISPATLKCITQLFFL